MMVESIAKTTAEVIELVGIAAVILGAGYALIRFFIDVTPPNSERKSAYGQLRRNLGRAILLGLEFLVAGDIIQTVAIEPSFESVGVLGLIVLVRTFLSFSLEVEISGKWPWQSEQRAA